MRLINFLSTLFFLYLLPYANAQLSVDAELRPRFEYRHGFKTLFPDNEDPAAFVSQRTRLNARYTTEKLNFYLSLQDVRVWGDVPQLNTADNGGLSVHQAWGAILFDKRFLLKLGRQEIAYDDQRIFGNVDWAQQARSHDAALLQFEDEKFKFDLGFAFNQDAENVVGNTFTIANTYKSIQYAWMHKDWLNFQVSFLFLNNGMQFIDETDSENNESRYSHTMGSHLRYSFGKLDFTSNLYLQLGKDVMNNDLNAYLLALGANYAPLERWEFTLGTELLSGNHVGAPTNGKNKAFNPLYGTNHKFNGLMDYFFVGNHIDNVGLWDVYVKAKLAPNQKSTFILALHNFASPSEIVSNISKQLGMEADLVYFRTINDNIVLSGGYSHLFANAGMKTIKNNFDANTNNWAWIMVTINPVLFKHPLP